MLAATAAASTMACGIRVMKRSSTTAHTLGWRAACPLLILPFVSPLRAFANDDLKLRVYAGVFNTDACVYDSATTDALEAGFEIQPVDAPWLEWADRGSNGRCD